MARHKGIDWSLPTGQLTSWDQVNAAILMDIRDELKQLNTTLGCYRVRQMCDDVRKIDQRLLKRGFTLQRRRK